MASFKAAMAKFSLDDVDDEGGVAKRRKIQREGGETSNHLSQREIKGGEASNPPQKETGGGGEIGVTIDPDLLDCSICFYPLCPPVNQVFLFFKALFSQKFSLVCAGFLVIKLIKG